VAQVSFQGAPEACHERIGVFNHHHSPWTEKRHCFQLVPDRGEVGLIPRMRGQAEFILIRLKYEFPQTGHDLTLEKVLVAVKNINRL
jgi:hypothetical protein